MHPGGLLFFLLSLLSLPFAGAAPYDVPLDYAPPVLSLDVRIHDFPTREIVPPEVKQVPLGVDAGEAPPVTIERGFTVEARAAVRVEMLTRSC